MVLYNQNHEFVGISSETLSYLGYEDLADFTSQHSDFANLLINKDGYIYKFSNFSWIDFVLYSGSPNKAGLLKLKSGEEVEIKISIKEVHLLHTIEGGEKFYSVRILSDNFINIASKTDASIMEKSPTNNSFTLNNLVTETHEEPAPLLNDVQPLSFEKETTPDINLTFPSTQELNQKENEFKLDFTQDSDVAPLTQESDEKPFVLNFPKTDPEETEKEIQEESHVSLHTQTPEPTIDEAPEFKLDINPSNTQTSQNTVNTFGFIKKEMQEETDDVAANHDAGFRLKEQPRDTHDANNPDIKVPQGETNPTQEPITLNFLKQTPESISTEISEIKTQQNTPNLTEEEPKKTLTISAPTSDNSTHDASLDFLKPETSQANASIISQIKNDIEEIDAPAELSHPVDSPKNTFTKTLSSLFITEHDDSKIDDEPAAVLKKNDIQDETPQEKPQNTVKHEKSDPFSSLDSLGLEKKEADTILAEFVQDTRENITLFKQYQHSHKVSQANYTLIKMQSSADILNLHAIIQTLSHIKQASLEEAPTEITQLMHTLEEQMDSLESHLMTSTV